jgi:hypothetical protein
MSEESVVDAPQAPNPSRDELFRLLTEEIKDINEAEKLKGWTPWVILATLVSALWILAQDLLRVQYSKRASVAVFLIATIALQVARIVQRDMDALSEDRTGKASFYFLHSNTSAFNLITMSAWMAGIAYAVLRLAPLATNRRVFLVGVALYTFMAITFLTMMVPVVARLPVPMPKRTPRLLYSLTISAIIISVLVALVIGVIRSGFTHNLTIVEIRIGTIVALGSIGIVYLSGSIGEQSDSRQALSEIRRDLVLGGMSTVEGSHRARTILQGMWLSDVVMKDMHALFKLISTARGEYVDSLGKAKTFKTNVGLVPAAEAPDIARLTLTKQHA